MDEKWWNDTAQAVSRHNFGIKSESDLRIIEKLILILGIPLSEHLDVDHKSHVRACHYFLIQNHLFHIDICVKQQ